MRILLIEDDPRLTESLKYQLGKEGFAVDACSDAFDGLHYMTVGSYDLVLLDRMLPGADGISLLRDARLQGAATPVIFLTAMGQLDDRIQGLDAGADDYIVKPFAFGELMARIRSVCRRPRALGRDDGVSYGDLSLEPSEKRLLGPKGECVLSKRESDLLEAFLRSPRKVLTRDALFLRVWGPAALVEDGNLDNYIHFLRRRLRALGSELGISTVRGVGYILAPDRGDGQ